MGQKWLVILSQEQNECMQKEVKFYVGIDVSKLWFDACMMMVTDHQKQPMVTARFDNDAPGIKGFDKWLRKYKVTFDENTLVVIENTGVYHRMIWQYCSTHHIPLYIGNAAHLKQSFGITRGKNDLIDSQRLCDYASTHADKLKATPVLNVKLMNVKDLMHARTRLLIHLNATKVYLKELKVAEGVYVAGLMEEAHQPAMQGLKASIAEIEQQIKQALASQPDVKRNYDLLISVPGIGHLTAVYMICCTNNFSSGITGKQLACYAGVVPFQDTSGKSIKGKNKVHKMANKELKKMLHLCAISSIKNYDEFRQYYERKKAQGKHPMSILNAIRNKIVLRAVSVVNNQRPYVDNYQKAA